MKTLSWTDDRCQMTDHPPRGTRGPSSYSLFTLSKIMPAHRAGKTFCLTRSYRICHPRSRARPLPAQQELRLTRARPRRFAPWRGGGGERNRTVDLLLAKQALSQLSYTPTALGIAQSPWRAPARTRSVRRESPHRADQPRAVNKAAVSRRPGLGWSLSGTRPLPAQQELRLTRRPRCAAGAKWWAREDLNLRPHAYQARALTN